MDVLTGLSFHFLHAATLHADRKSIEIHTILGSCVSVCLYDYVLRFGGINHYMLPLWKGEGLATLRYGNIAIEKLLEKMLLLGGSKKNIVAKIFGGANSMGDNTFYGIGKQNVQLAESQLSTYHIPIVSSNVGGCIGRKILFNTESGLVYMKFIND
jgi:chemotaxis protein CheD